MKFANKASFITKQEQGISLIKFKNQTVLQAFWD